MYLGQDWDSAVKPRGGTQNASGANSAGAPAHTPLSSASTWSLVLGTFTDDNHAQAAEEMVRQLRLASPPVVGARTHPATRGTMVVYGNYTGRDDPKAKADEEALRKVSFRGQPMLGRIMLARLEAARGGPGAGALHPFDLMSARQAHPSVNPLYSLDVAVWIANDDPKLGDRISFDEVKKRAEAYARELRARNIEAYFYHDESGQRSSVTVGLFDRRAIDPRSQLYSIEVEDWIKRFPQRLANGEPLNEFIDKYKPDKGVQPQKPMLVLVP